MAIAAGRLAAAKKAGDAHAKAIRDPADPYQIAAFYIDAFLADARKLRLKVADEFPERAFGDRRSFGLVAQEVERVLPELVTTDEDGFKAVNYSKLPLLAIQAIKELKEKNDALEARLAALEARDHGTKEPR